MELFDKVHSVERVNNVRKVATRQEDNGGSTFDDMYAQANQTKVRKLEDMPVNVNPDVMKGKMNYYNNRAMEAYFCMTFSTTDLRG